MKRFLIWAALAAAMLLSYPAWSNVARAAEPSANDADSVELVTGWLVANGATRDRADAVAPAILHWSGARSLDPLLIVGIIGVENNELRNGSRSPMGATGVMQVMPHWKRDIHECGYDLRDPEVNVCFGTKILRMNLDATGNIHRALLRYNGCSRGACSVYPNLVFSRAGRAVLLARAD